MILKSDVRDIKFKICFFIHFLTLSCLIENVLLCRWKNLQGDLNNYKAKLGAALELHAFNRDVDDFNDRVHEKSALLSVQDLGKDLAGVQALQRKQEDIERDMSALQNQLEVQRVAIAF